jgi:putative SOS response-associated peptidase YedK
MCGRYALHSHPQVVALEFGLEDVPVLSPRYNIAPTSQVLVVRAHERVREAALVRWGLVPRWAKDASIGARMNNARAETVAEKPSFREAWRRRRCLVPANGFYEWKLEDGRKQPYYITPAAGELFAFGGLWESWQGPQGTLESCAIVTIDANEPMSAVHDRMPVLVPLAGYARWLDCTPGTGVADLLRPAAADAIAIRRVSRAVNNARNDLPELIAPES